MLNNVAIWEEIRRQAYAEIRDTAKMLIESNLSAEGSAYGDRPLSLGDRIERFIMDAQDGTLDILRYQSPAIYKEYVEQYAKDVMNSPLMKVQ